MVVNSSHWMSEIGSRLAPDCDFAMIWYYDHKHLGYNCSLRAFHETTDVSEISKKFGGGGHKKAAGFRLPAEIHPDSIFNEIVEEPAVPIEEPSLVVEKFEDETDQPNVASTTPPPTED